MAVVVVGALIALGILVMALGGAKKGAADVDVYRGPDGSHTAGDLVLLVALTPGVAVPHLVPLLV